MTDLKDSSMQIEWDSIEGANSYYLYIDSANTPIEVTDATYLLEGLEPKTFYNIQISTYSGHVEGAKSEVFTQKTKVEAAVLQPYKKGATYLLGKGAIGDTIANCRIYKKGESAHFATGTMTDGDLKIYLGNNANIVVGNEYDVRVIDGNPNGEFIAGMPATFTVLPAA